MNAEFQKDRQRTIKVPMQTENREPATFAYISAHNLRPPVLILQVEDDPNDVLLMQMAFIRAGISNPVLVVEDGEQAIDYLRGSGAFANRSRYPFPDIILLDLHMPRLDGFDVLRWLRDQQLFTRAPSIIVFTSSECPEDIELAYQLGASSFIVKPFTTEERVEIARLLKGWWLNHNRFPAARQARAGAAAEVNCGRHAG